jgi:hypothetical protein
MPIQHAWVIPCRNLIIGTALAVSVLGADVNWEDSDGLQEKIESYIKANSEYEAKLQKYEEIAEDFNKHVTDERYQAVMNELRATILSYNALANNWDGYGAIPVGINNANLALYLLDFLTPAAIKQMDDCYPESNGTMSMQWKNKMQEKVSVNIGASSISFYVKLSGVETEYYNKVVLNEQNGKLLCHKIESIIFA